MEQKELPSGSMPAGSLPPHGLGFTRLARTDPFTASGDGTVTYDIADLPESERTSYRWTGERETFPDIGVALDRINKLKEGSDAVRAYDAQFRRKALLSASPTARIWLDPGQAKKDPGGRPSTRAFVEYCAGLLAASGEEVTACPSGRVETVTWGRCCYSIK